MRQLRVQNRSSSRFFIGAVLALGLLLAACSDDDTSSQAPEPADDVAADDMADDDMATMGDSELTEGLAFPPVAGLYEDEEILFIHNATSDADIANLLTNMMGSSPVIHVPALADIPPSALGTVLVFTNGVEPDGAMGPFGFQPDVFDSVPGDAGYSPLRRVVTVNWAEPTTATVLTSVAAVESAEADGRVALEETDIVVSMPLLRWPDGER